MPLRATLKWYGGISCAFILINVRMPFTQQPPPDSVLMETAEAATVVSMDSSAKFPNPIGCFQNLGFS